jgi:hypothetical protein
LQRHKSNKEEVTIIDQSWRPCAYSISNAEDFEVFFRNLDLLSVHNEIPLSLSERQREDENGVFIDIDFYHPMNVRVYSNTRLLNIVKRYVSLLLDKYYDIDNEFTSESTKALASKKYSLRAFVFEKRLMSLSKDRTVYKEGYHILLPNLYVPKTVRKEIIIELNTRDANIDKNSYGVPVLLYNNVKKANLEEINVLQNSAYNKLRMCIEVEIVSRNPNYGVSGVSGSASDNTFEVDPFEVSDVSRDPRANRFTVQYREINPEDEVRSLKERNVNLCKYFSLTYNINSFASFIKNLNSEDLEAYNPDAYLLPMALPIKAEFKGYIRNRQLQQQKTIERITEKIYKGILDIDDNDEYCNGVVGADGMCGADGLCGGDTADVGSDVLPELSNRLLEETISFLCSANPRTHVVKQLLDILPQEFHEDRNNWRNIVYAIYSHGKKDAYPIAQWFSKKSPHLYNKKALDELWTDTSERYEYCVNPITEKSIYFLARKHNPVEYEKVMESNYNFLIEESVFKNKDILQHYFIAKLLHDIKKSEVIYDIANKKWWCYMDERNMGCFDSAEPAFIYKWFCEEIPLVLNRYISEDFTKYIDGVISSVNARNAKEENKIIIEQGKEKIKNLLRTKRKLGDSAFKRGIVEQCRFIFNNFGFLAKMDSYDNVIGTTNGIIELPCEENAYKLNFINGFHEYYISKFVNVPYNPTMCTTKHFEAVHDIINSIFPEPDAKEFIMVFLSSSLSNAFKEPMILFLRGVGSNGKSTILEFLLRTMGSYAKKLSLGLITDRREGSERANSAFMELKNIRFGYFSEPNKSEIINTGRLKEVLGNESLTGRELYGKQENFYNRSNLVAASNYEFIIDTSDNGTWRRIKNYVCKVKFMEKPDPNKQFEKKVNKKIIMEYINNPVYLQTFFIVLLEYYQKFVDLYKKDMNRVSCPTIDKETLAYRNKQDYINKFIMVYLVYSPGSKVVMDELVEEIREWIVYTSWGKKNVDELQSQLENSILATKFMEYSDDGYSIQYNNIRSIYVKKTDRNAFGAGVYNSNSTTDSSVDERKSLLPGEIPLYKYLMAQ